MNDKQLAALTENQQRMARASGLNRSLDPLFYGQDMLAVLTDLANAKLELETWREEFSRSLEDGRPYIQDASEAGQELADTAARARMAEQDLENARLDIIMLKEKYGDA